MTESRLLRDACFMLLVVLMLPMAAPAAGQNVALNRPYTCTPVAKYEHTKGDGDAVQLTDGLSATGDCLWVDRKAKPSCGLFQIRIVWLSMSAPTI